MLAWTNNRLRDNLTQLLGRGGGGGGEQIKWEDSVIFSWEITLQLQVTMSLLSNLSMTRFYSFVLKVVSVYIFFFRSCHTACWILVSQPGIEAVPLTVKVWRLNQWTTREFPGDHFLKKAIQSILRLWDHEHMSTFCSNCTCGWDSVIYRFKNYNVSSNLDGREEEVN